MSTSTIAPCWHCRWSVCLLNVHTTGVLCKWCQCCVDAHLNRLLSLREAYVACLWYCSRFIRSLYIVVHDECACLFLTIFLPNLNRLLDLCSVFSWQGFFHVLMLFSYLCLNTERRKRNSDYCWVKKCNYTLAPIGASLYRFFHLCVLETEH